MHTNGLGTCGFKLRGQLFTQFLCLLSEVTWKDCVCYLYSLQTVILFYKHKNFNKAVFLPLSTVLQQQKLSLKIKTDIF